MKVSNKKVLLYFDDVYGMWHIPFFEYIMKSLTNANYEVLLVAWSIYPKNAFSSYNIILLDKINIEHQKPSDPDKRARLLQIASILKQYSPDLFLVDHFPFWRFSLIDELDIIFRWFKKNNKKVITFMRDIYIGKKLLEEYQYHNMLSIYSESEKWFNPEWIQELKRFNSVIKNKFYKKPFITEYVFRECSVNGVIVFWDKKIHDIRTELNITSSTFDSIYHIGYIPLSIDNTPVYSQNSKNKKILVSTWWNLSSPKIFYRLIDFLLKLPDFQIQILLWPHINYDIKKKIKDQVSGFNHINISWFHHDFQSLLNASDFFFGFWWYGTFQHLFYYEWHSFIMSNWDTTNFFHRYHEQSCRIQKFHQYLNIDFLDEVDEVKIRKILQKRDLINTKKKLEILFCREDVIIKTIEEIMNKK